MIERDHRAGFGEPVALYHQKSESRPKRLDLRVYFSATNYQRPEFEAQPGVHFAISPPALQNSGNSFALWRNVRRMEFALDFVRQIHQQLRHRNQHRDALSPDGAQNGPRVHFPHEHARAAEQWRDEDAKRLSEKVAQRRHVENAHRLKCPRPFLVLAHLRLAWRQVGADVLVLVYDTHGFARSA